MWEFISQNWWILFFVAMMFVMHRSGGAGCCGGEREHGQRKDLQDENLRGVSNNSGHDPK
ncbi:hypothetical protein [Desulfitobacterium sp.]|uniref:hypothetical protein n=1 Tax=Desulfitobacterium sp. TaxID=49981 RepID=UPI002B74D5C9|nr:hypothetical protein [Desulfitobacterium sp.]HVJ47703.1 hypothetical protein [Desulfitobacterium sp.]